MSISQRVFIAFRIWLNRFFGFQNYKLGDRFSRSENMARYYSLFLVVLIVVVEALHIYYLRPVNNNNFRIPDLALLLQSVTTATSAALAILSDSFFCAREKVKQFKNFQQIHRNFFDETFTQSPALQNTNTVSTALITTKVLHATAALLVLQWDKFTLFVIFRTFILTLMILNILTDIYTCQFYVKCINNRISTYYQQLSAQNRIDFRETSFILTSWKGAEEELVQKDKHNSDIKRHIKIYALIIDNLNIISKRFKYAVGINKNTQ